MSEKTINMKVIAGPIMRGLAHRYSWEKFSRRTLMITSDLQSTLEESENAMELKSMKQQSRKEEVKLSIYEVLRYMDRISNEEALPIAYQIVNIEEDKDVCAEWFITDAKYYLALKRIMKRFQCNAYSVSCHELCNLQIPQSNNLVLGIAHSLLEKEGVACDCEENKIMNHAKGRKLAYA